MPILVIAGFFVIKGLAYPAYLEKPLVLSGLPQTSPLAKVGVADGDRVLAVNDSTTPTWSTVNTYLLQAASDGIIRFTIDRQGAQRTVDVKAADIRNADRALGNLPVPALVRPVDRGMPASRAGLQRGDLVVAVKWAPRTKWSRSFTVGDSSQHHALDT